MAAVADAAAHVPLQRDGDPLRRDAPVEQRLDGEPHHDLGAAHERCRRRGVEASPRHQLRHHARPCRATWCRRRRRSRRRTRRRSSCRARRERGDRRGCVRRRAVRARRSPPSARATCRRTAPQRREPDPTGDDDHVRARGLGDRPAGAERPAHAEDVTGLGGAERARDRTDAPHRQHERRDAADRSADRDRHLADAEDVDHHELPGCDRGLFARRSARASASRCRRSPGLARERRRASEPSLRRRARTQAPSP